MPPKHVRHFYFKNSKILWGGAPSGAGGGHLLPHLPPRRLDLRAFGAHLRTPTRKSGYGPAAFQDLNEDVYNILSKFSSNMPAKWK